MAQRSAKRPAEALPAEPGRQLPKALHPAAAAALVFIAAGAVLVLEILAVRLLVPYVGLTLEATTSIIGAVLAGIALGAAVGGYFADRTNTRLLIVGLLIVGGLLALLTVPAVRWLGPTVRGDGNTAALGIALLTLLPVAAVLSAVSPAVAHLQLHDLRASGTIVGRLSAWATAGALIGTFGTGFVIVPLMPVSSAVLAIGLIVVLTGISLGASSRLLSTVGVVAVVIATSAAGALAATSDSPCMLETRYHCVGIAIDPSRPGGRELILDEDHNSYIDLNDPTYLDYVYTRWIAEAIEAQYPSGVPLNGVFVGGGAFTLPRWLDATRPGSSAHVLEVDGELVDFDKEHFGLRTSPDLTAAVGDARNTIREVPDNSADVVVGDAFSGYTIPWHLTTAEWLEEVRHVLKPGGLYVLNAIDLPPLEFLDAEAATMLDAFAEVRLVGYPGEEGLPYGGNLILLGSDRPMPSGVGASAEGAVTYTDAEVESFAAGTEPLRDDYAPVDQLRTVE